MPRRSADQAAITRKRILQAARAAFAELGFAGAATTAIARRAGVTEGALYYHFRNKRDLFRQVFLALEAELAAHARAAARAGEPMAAFLAGARAALDLCVRPDFKRIVMIEGPTVLGDAGWRGPDAGVGLDAVARGLRGIAGSDRLSMARARGLAVLVMGAMNQVIIAVAREEPDVEADASLRDLERMIRALLAA
ncbi:MAG: TetR family transcriptional regulator [Pseudomonadota bacterium]